MRLYAVEKNNFTEASNDSILKTENISKLLETKDFLFIENGKPVMYADIDKLGDTKDDKRGDTKVNKEFGVTELLNTQFFKSSKIGGEFLRRKRKIIDSRNKIKKKTVVI